MQKTSHVTVWYKGCLRTFSGSGPGALWSVMEMETEVREIMLATSN